MRLGKHVDKKTDNWSDKSKKKLKASVRHKMKRIYVGILDALDKERADGLLEDETFKKLRSKILNIGNDQIRNMESELDNQYNIEFLNYHIDFKIIPPPE